MAIKMDENIETLYVNFTHVFEYIQEIVFQ